MSYPLKVGGGVLPEYRRDQYNDEVHDFLVAVSDEEPVSGEKVSGGGWFASIAIIGAIDLTTGHREKGRTIMIWDPTPEEQQEAYKTLFREYGIYRVKGHPPAKFWYSTPSKRMGGMYLTEITRGHVTHPFLEEAIREYKESLHLHSELLGTLDLDDDGYTGSFDWLGADTKITVSVEYTPYTKPLGHLEDFCRECEKNDRELRRFARENMPDRINKDREKPLTPEEFARGLTMDSIVMYYDGDYDVYFRFEKYTVNISGDRDGPRDIWQEVG